MVFNTKLLSTSTFAWLLLQLVQFFLCHCVCGGNFDGDFTLLQSPVHFVYPNDGAYVPKGNISFRLFHPLVNGGPLPPPKRYNFFISLRGQGEPLNTITEEVFFLNIGTEGSYVIEACSFDADLAMCTSKSTSMGFDVLPDPYVQQGKAIAAGILRHRKSDRIPRRQTKGPIKVLHISDLRHMDGYKIHLLRQLTKIPTDRVFQQVVDLSCDFENPEVIHKERPFATLLRKYKIPTTEICLKVPLTKRWSNISSWVKDLDRLATVNNISDVRPDVLQVLRPLIKVLQKVHILIITNGAVAQDTYLAELGRLVKIPAVLMDLGSRGPQLLPYSYRGITAFIVQSTFMKEFPAVKDSHVETILLPPIVDDTLYSYTSANETCPEVRKELLLFLHKKRKGERISPEKVIVAFVGRIVTQKGVGIFLRSVKYFLRHLQYLSHSEVDIQFLIIGEGAARKHFEKIVKDGGLKDLVFFTGFISNQELPCVLKEVSLLVFPSLFPESFGMVNIEASLMHIPLVAFGVGGTPDFLVHGQNGEIVTDRSPKALALTVHKLATNKTLRQFYGGIGAEMASSHFGTQNLLDRTESIYERVCEDNDCWGKIS